MSLKITGLNELRERLERLRPEEVMARALAERAQRMAARVRESLSEPPGAAGHDEPWLQSGALRSSVGAHAEGLQAVVESSDLAAVPQELGTAHMPARPFLASAAAEMGEEVARAVGAAVAALRGDGTDGFDPSGVQLISDSGEHPDPDDVPAKKDLEVPEHTHTHTPQPMPGLNSPFPTVPLPITPGGVRGPASAGAGGGRPTPVGPSTESLASESGILRSAAQGKGNFGIGQDTEAAADRLGRAWVGCNPTLASDGRTLIGQDGLRQYRPPSFKPNLGKVQANFEQRLVPQGQWESNGYLDIVK